jgi:hypothetical protein
MATEKCSGAQHELSREEIEALVWRGRELHSRAFHEVFARLSAAIGSLYGKILHRRDAGSQKLIHH